MTRVNSLFIGRVEAIDDRFSKKKGQNTKKNTQKNRAAILLISTHRLLHAVSVQTHAYLMTEPKDQWRD